MYIYTYRRRYGVAFCATLYADDTLLLQQRYNACECVGVFKARYSRLECNQQTLCTLTCAILCYAVFATAAREVRVRAVADVAVNNDNDNNSLLIHVICPCCLS